jgi:hypothetical protein
MEKAYRPNQNFYGRAYKLIIRLLWSAGHAYVYINFLGLRLMDKWKQKSYMDENRYAYNYDQCWVSSQLERFKSKSKSHPPK